MSDPIYMLTVALGWGVAFLTLGSAIAIVNRLLSGDQAGAFFGSGGVLPLILYFALLGGLINLAIVWAIASAAVRGGRGADPRAPWGGSTPPLPAPRRSRKNWASG